MIIISSSLIIKKIKSPLRCKILAVCALVFLAAPLVAMEENSFNKKRKIKNPDNIEQANKRVLEEKSYVRADYPKQNHEQAQYRNSPVFQDIVRFIKKECLYLNEGAKKNIARLKPTANKKIKQDFPEIHIDIIKTAIQQARNEFVALTLILQREKATLLLLTDTYQKLSHAYIEANEEIMSIKLELASHYQGENNSDRRELLEKEVMNIQARGLQYREDIVLCYNQIQQLKKKIEILSFEL